MPAVMQWMLKNGWNPNEQWKTTRYKNSLIDAIDNLNVSFAEHLIQLPGFDFFLPAVSWGEPLLELPCAWNPHQQNLLVSLYVIMIKIAPADQLTSFMHNNYSLCCTSTVGAIFCCTQEYAEILCNALWERCGLDMNMDNIDFCNLRCSCCHQTILSVRMHLP
jgi:hypothetical protein